jgi:hypothetical protein
MLNVRLGSPPSEHRDDRVDGQSMADLHEQSEQDEFSFAESSPLWTAW